MREWQTPLSLLRHLRSAIVASVSRNSAAGSILRSSNGQGRPHEEGTHCLKVRANVGMWYRCLNSCSVIHSYTCSQKTRIRSALDFEPIGTRSEQLYRQDHLKFASWPSSATLLIWNPLSGGPIGTELMFSGGGTKILIPLKVATAFPQNYED